MGAHTPTFQERIDRMQVTLRSVGGFAGDPAAEDVAQEVEMVAQVVSEVADLVGVLADLQGSRPAGEHATAKLGPYAERFDIDIDALASAHERAMDSAARDIRDAIETGFNRLAEALQR
jgi:hypothetical protein